MHTPIAADRDLCTSHGAGRDDGSGRRIHPNRLGECGPVPQGHIERIAVRRLAAKVDEMCGPTLVDCCLWLSGVFGQSLNRHHRAREGSRARNENRAGHRCASEGQPDDLHTTKCKALSRPASRPNFERAGADGPVRNLVHVGNSGARRDAIDALFDRYNIVGDSDRGTSAERIDDAFEKQRYP